MLQQKHLRILAGDVGTVGSWMTLPYVAHVYHVPAACLDQSLDVARPALQKHATLGYLASYYKKNVTNVIHTVQATILNYRTWHPVCSSPQTRNVPDQSIIPFPEQRGGFYG